MNLSDLPDEILFSIFSHLAPFKDISNIALICNRFRNIIAGLNPKSVI